MKIHRVIYYRMILSGILKDLNWPFRTQTECTFNNEMCIRTGNWRSTKLRRAQTFRFIHSGVMDILLNILSRFFLPILVKKLVFDTFSRKPPELRRHRNQVSGVRKVLFRHPAGTGIDPRSLLHRRHRFHHAPWVVSPWTTGSSSS